MVGADRLPDSGYLRAKLAQENLIKASTIPYTIVRSTQFFEFLKGIAQSSTVGQTVRLSPALLQPIASDDVVAALADATLGAPVNGTIEIAGPEQLPLDQLARRYLRANQDPRQVVGDAHARYFGAEINDQSLTAGDNPRLGSIRFEDWLGRSAPRQMRELRCRNPCGLAWPCCSASLGSQRHLHAGGARELVLCGTWRHVHRTFRPAFPPRHRLDLLVSRRRLLQ